MEKRGRKYDLIYADPPWQYHCWSKKGRGRSAEAHYRTQSDRALAEMDVPSLSAANCVLLMWATFPCLEQALDLGRAWGFIYKTVAFTWVKKNRKDDRLFLGMGHYTRANAEVVLLFTKGRPLPRCSRSIPQILVSPRARHSEKPDEIRKRIGELFGRVHRLELFARESSAAGTDIFSGWDVFGDQVTGSIKINHTRVIKLKNHEKGKCRIPDEPDRVRGFRTGA